MCGRGVGVYNVDAITACSFSSTKRLIDYHDSNNQH